VASQLPAISVDSATANAEAHLSRTRNEIPAKLEYVLTEDDALVLAHTVQIKSHDDGHLLEAFVDAHSGDVVAVNDFTTSITVR
ncbi:hypothetical protein AURDEDRAFT_23530, partial [Auricularia subglabra TFB-10046 SS5]